MIWTLAFVATGTLAAAAVAYFTWRNAQPTGTVAQLLHATEESGRTPDGH
jgi:hypothetical protein